MKKTVFFSLLCSVFFASLALAASSTCPYEINVDVRPLQGGYKIYELDITAVVDELVISNIIADRGNTAVFGDFNSAVGNLAGDKNVRPFTNYPLHLRFGQTITSVTNKKHIELIIHTNHGVWTTRLK